MALALLGQNRHHLSYMNGGRTEGPEGGAEGTMVVVTIQWYVPLYVWVRGWAFYAWQVLESNKSIEHTLT